MLNIVLFEPEIPQNTGNIMRTCVAINAKLHLIEPLGFSLDDKYLKRSQLDYIKYLDYEVYPNYENFVANNPGSYYYLSRYGHLNYYDIDYNLKSEDVYLIFGKESTGIAKEILVNNLDKTFRIPTTDKVRSLNLSNCVAIVSYDYISKTGFKDLELEEPSSLKGANFLDNLKDLL